MELLFCIPIWLRLGGSAYRSKNHGHPPSGGKVPTDPDPHSKGATSSRPAPQKPLEVAMERRRTSCHCGAVVIDMSLPEGLASAQRCDCSARHRRGAVAVTALAADLTVFQGADNLSLYTWGTGTAKHYFRKTCGIYTHRQRRSDPSECGVNLGAIDGVNPRDLDVIACVDGVNHPSDRQD